MIEIGKKIILFKKIVQGKTEIIAQTTENGFDNKVSIL